MTYIQTILGQGSQQNLPIGWKVKAFAMAACAALPGGTHVYPWLQSRFGRLNWNATNRIPHSLRIIELILRSNRPIEGKDFFEVGTGHVPIVPIALYLAGANSVTTVDLYPRLSHKGVTETLRWLVRNQEFVVAEYGKLVDKKQVCDRLTMLTNYSHDPAAFLESARIRCRAPADAGCTGLPDESFDYHLSVTTLEHISPGQLAKIFKEGGRLIRSDGLAIHFIDLSDHFAQQDSSISSINFLKYSELQWRLIGGNQFAYCNRLRFSDYQAIFEQTDFRIISEEKLVDQEMLQKFAENLSSRREFLHQRFRNYTAEDLCTTAAWIVLAKSPVAKRHDIARTDR